MDARKEAVKTLESGGYIFARHGRNHDIYFNPETKLTIPVKRHDFDEDDLRYILKEAKLDKYKKGKGKGQ